MKSLEYSLRNYFTPKWGRYSHAKGGTCVFVVRKNLPFAPSLLFALLEKIKGIFLSHQF